MPFGVIVVDWLQYRSNDLSDHCSGQDFVDDVHFVPHDELLEVQSEGVVQANHRQHHEQRFRRHSGPFREERLP